MHGIRPEDRSICVGEKSCVLYWERWNIGRGGSDGGNDKIFVHGNFLFNLFRITLEIKYRALTM